MRRRQVWCCCFQAGRRRRNGRGGRAGHRRRRRGHRRQQRRNRRRGGRRRGEELAVYGDAAYGSGDTLERLEGLGADPKVKSPPPTSRNGHYTKDDFRVDLAAGTVICPAGATATISFRGDGSGTATFGAQCHTCPLRA
ncbi:MAG: hypothetical protein BRC31_06040 [Actinobacteria bacterium QS_5_72_10]|nr:MAG: hypothetical protein BRC31_06040 [Actinobacteria bacterium QS_5_72_10]